MMDSCEIRLAESAVQEIRSLPGEAIALVMEEILKLQRTPRPAHSRPLIGSTDAYRLPAGDYRVFYTIDEEARSVTVYHVGRRREVLETKV